LFFELVRVLDIVGVIAFSFVGVQKAKEKNLDLFGAVLLGTLTPIGGGVLRDMVNGTFPYALANEWYFGLALLSSAFLAIFLRNGVHIPKNLVEAGDLLGLAAFAVVGASVAMAGGKGPLVTMLYAILTAAFGGLLSDVLINNVSKVLNREVYASAAGIGGLAFFFAYPLGVDAAAIAGFATTAGLRFATVKWGINLPKMRSGKTQEFKAAARGKR
jgi:uncharacterized membrane protein YeiH